MKVLFIDDDIQTEILYEVLKAQYPKDNMSLVYKLYDAHQILWSLKFDVMVLDIMMNGDEKVVPGSTEKGGVLAGLLLLDMVRIDKSCINQKTPVILLTGVPAKRHPKIAAAEIEHKGRYFTKPVRPDVLYETIARMIHGKA